MDISKISQKVVVDFINKYYPDLVDIDIIV